MTADYKIVEEKASSHTKLKLLITNKIAMIVAQKSHEIQIHQMRA